MKVTDDHTNPITENLRGDEPDFDTMEDPEEEARILKSLARKNKLRIFIPLALVVLLSYLLFGGPFKYVDSQKDSTQSSEGSSK